MQVLNCLVSASERIKDRLAAGLRPISLGSLQRSPRIHSLNLLGKGREKGDGRGRKSVEMGEEARRGRREVI